MNAVDLLMLQMHAAGLPKPETEYRFHPDRKWRADLALMDHRLLIEVDGGVYVKGRHVRGEAFEKDRERDAWAMIAGWRVLRVTPRQVKDGKALGWIQKILLVNALSELKTALEAK